MLVIPNALHVTKDFLFKTAIAFKIITAKINLERIAQFAHSKPAQFAIRVQFSTRKDKNVYNLARFKTAKIANKKGTKYSAFYARQTII